MSTIKKLTVLIAAALLIIGPITTNDNDGPSTMPPVSFNAA